MPFTKKFLDSLEEDPVGHRHMFEGEISSRSIFMGQGNHTHIIRETLMSLSKDEPGHTHFVGSTRTDVPLEPRKDHRNAKTL